MNLEAQIQLITVPQEFARLCNAALVAEYGDDFLPIDDDRPDRGNDGYLKSAKRLFAVHCFKRVQNQSLDQEVRRKMVGDLGKAIALKSEDLWDIEGWTFISNYPIDEETGRKAIGLGRKAGIDVLWRGPDFLARVLTEHDAVRSQFPALQVSEIGERLDEIKNAVSDGDGSSASSPKPPDRVPRTEDEKRELMATRPPGWEYLLFAYALLRGKNDLEMKWHDHNMPPFRRSFGMSDVVEASKYLDREIDNFLALTEAMMAVFPKEAQEQTFGAPGEAGDPIRIEHTAGRIIQTYEGIMDWAAGIRSVQPPETMQGAFEIAPHMADRPLEIFRDFVDRAVREMDALPERLRNVDEDGELVVVSLDLTLDADQQVMDEFNRRMKRAHRKQRWGF